jgi:hypothetical protein
MPIVHSKANGQFIKSGAVVGTAGKKLDKATIAKIDAGKYTGPPPKAKKGRKKGAKKGRSAGAKKSSGASAATTARNAKLDAARAARTKAAKAKFAASQHKKAVHKAVTAKRHVMLLQKRAAAAGATADDKLRASQALQTFTRANAAYDKQKTAAKSAQAAFNKRHAKGTIKVAAKGSGRVLATGSVGGAAPKGIVRTRKVSTVHKSPVHSAAHRTKHATKVRSFGGRGGRNTFN